MNRYIATIIVLVFMILGTLFGLYAILQIMVISPPIGEIIPSVAISGVSFLVCFVVRKYIPPSLWVSCSFCIGSERIDPFKGYVHCNECGGTGRVPRPKD